MKRKQTTTIPFGEWLPDLPDFGNPGMTVADGVIPDKLSYRPLISPTSNLTGGYISSRPRGYSGAVGAGHQSYLYVGDDSALYSLVADEFVDASKSGGYGLASDSVWEFAQFGETFIGTSFDDPIQSIVPGDPNFADMITSTNQPKARHLGVVGQFLVLGHTNDGTDGVKRSRVWWSAIRDQTDFDPDSATQCDYEDLKEGGDVQRIIGGVEYGLVFCERAIFRMTYVGPPLVFRFDPVDRKRGTPIPGSVVSLGRNVYYLSDEGFYMTDGVQSYPIGNGKVDRTFWDQFNLEDRTFMSAAVDPLNKLIVWAFPSTDLTENQFGFVPCRFYFYNWAENKWSSYDNSIVSTIGNSFSPGVTLEEIGGIYPDLETVPFSLDAISWTGGTRIMSVFAGVSSMSGDRYTYGLPGTGKAWNVAATLTTGLLQLSSGRRTVVNRVRPLVDGGAVPSGSNVSVEVSGIEDLANSDSFNTASSVNDIGDTSQRADGRYHKVRVNIPALGRWDHAQGIEVEHTIKGKR